MDRLDNGTRIPVGGKSIYSGENNIFVEADFSEFDGFLREASAVSERIKNSQIMAEWLEKSGVDRRVFAAIGGFTKVYDKSFQEEEEEAENKRKDLYTGDRPVKLSEVFSLHAQQCAEIAALGQFFLQEEGISSTYFNGAVLWDRNEEFAEAHTFIPIHFQGKSYIYDPTNPTKTTEGNFPSLYSVDGDFSKAMQQSKKTFARATNLLSGKEVFFGMDNGTNVVAERDIVGFTK